MNCLAAGLQMAGTVMTHRMSFSLYFSSPVLSRMISIARSLRYLNEWAKTAKASIFFPFRAVSFVFLSNVCNRRRQIYKDCLILWSRLELVIDSPSMEVSLKAWQKKKEEKKKTNEWTVPLTCVVPFWNVWSKDNLDLHHQGSWRTFLPLRIQMNQSYNQGEEAER